jgi:SAM-dependent methyltransferase
MTMTELREQVRERYAAAALVVHEGKAADDRGDGTCCGPSGSMGCAPEDGIGPMLYELADRDVLPDSAVLASMGCGNPTAVAELGEGETVLDLGSGGGIDVLLSARRVGPGGKVYGLDMTEEMLTLARQNAAKAGATNVEFIRGYIEAIPLPDASVDVVISNCVINLSTDKAAVIGEIARVLRPGGRVGVSDVVADDHLTPSDRAERGSFVGCIAGALTFAEYLELLGTAGFAAIEIDATHELTDCMHGAIVRAVKPGA